MKLLITGGTGYIGSNIITHLLQDNHSIFYTYRNDSKNKELIDNINTSNNLFPIRYDCHENNLRTLIDSIQPIDCFINCIVINKNKPFLRFTSDEFDDCIETNLNINFRIIKKLIRYRKLKSGHIILFLSYSGLTGNPGQLLYNITKSALTGFIKSAAIELSRKKICINGVCPGLFPSKLVNDLSEDKQHKLMNNLLIKDFNSIDNLMNFIYWLINQNNVTGQIYNLDSRFLYNVY